MKTAISTKTFLLLGLLGAVVVGAGEFLLHFVPGGPEGEISMLEKVPLARASKGHFLAVLGTPLYYAGYYGLMRFFQKDNPVMAGLLLVAGALSFTFGGVYVSSRYFAAEVLQRSAGTVDHAFYLQSYEDHYQVLVWSLRILITAVSVIYVMLILKNKQGVPKWLAIFNPIVLLILIISTLVWARPIGQYIAPVAMNTTHLIFFGLVLFQLKKNKPL